MEKENKKEKYKTTIKKENELYEMIYDRLSNETSFIKIDKDGNREHFLKEVTFDDCLHKPLPPDNVLIEKNVVLFPGIPAPFESEKELLNDIKKFIHKYLDISEIFEEIATYYVLFSWVYDKFNEVPYLRAIGDYGSGKSRFLQTIGSLCYKPIFTGGATTPSPIFRIVDEIKGTLIMDEADFRFSDKTSEIIKILNTGYQKGLSVLRSEGKGTFEVKAYEVFSPKIVATRETFTDQALESRFLVEEMGVKKMRDDIPRTLEKEFHTEAEVIRNKLLMWRLENYFKPLNKQTELIKGIHPRLNQIVLPLFSVIKDDSIKENLKRFIIKYNGELIEDRGLTWESDIIYAITRIIKEKDSDEITLKEIAEVINFEMDNEDSITPKKIGWYLKKRLGFRTDRKRNGYIFSVKRNSKKLELEKEKFGIVDKSESELVNDVNNIDVESDNLTTTNS